MAHQRKIELISQLKKSYSTITNGLKLAMVRDGVSKLEDTKLCSCINPDTDVQPEFMKEFAQIFQVSKSYDVNEYLDGDGQGNNLVSYVYLNGSPTSPPEPANHDHRIFILNDGSILYPGFNKTPVIYYNDGNLDEAIGTITVDINGAKKPNQWGRDVFAFYIGNDGALFPYGGKDFALADWGPAWNVSSAFGCSKDSEGKGCAARIIEEGWEMKY